MIPISFLDLSLLFATTALILIVTAEVLRQYVGRTRLRIHRKRLRYTSIVFSILFLATVAARIVGIITSP